MTPELHEIMIYWDRQGDPEGWAYRTRERDPVTQDDTLTGDSGECDVDQTGDEAEDLRQAVVQIAYERGVTITPDAVTYDPNEGGFAIWTRVD